MDMWIFLTLKKTLDFCFRNGCVFCCLKIRESRWKKQLTNQRSHTSAFFLQQHTSVAAVQYVQLSVFCIHHFRILHE